MNESKNKYQRWWYSQHKERMRPIKRERYRKYYAENKDEILKRRKDKRNAIS